MGQINDISQQTKNRFLNFYALDAISQKNTPVHYFVASRAKSVDELKLKTRKNRPDGVAIYSLYGEQKDQVVLVRQYRYAIDDYIYELPAGLVDEGENYHQAGVRELKEETGLTFTPVKVDERYEKPYFTTIGMTDESCATVYGYATGQISKDGQEDTEEIEIVLADRQEAARILKEENVAIMAAYMLMHFIYDEDAFGFLHITE